MKLTDSKYIADLLKSFGFYTQKDLGQNFLICEESLEAIIEAAAIEKGDEVLEVGPGPGVLTQALLKSEAKKISALEIDEKVIPVLKHTTKEWSDRLEIIHTNALEYETQLQNYIFAANIPYYLTSPILRHFLGSKNKPKRAIILVQKEVAEKICCKDKDQSILSLLVKIYGKPEIVKIVKKECFFPAPKVDSAIIKVELYENCLIPEELLEKFWKVTKQAFSQKRKKLNNTLGKQQASAGKTFKDIFESLDIDMSRRAQTLSIQEWVSIVKEI